MLRVEAISCSVNKRPIVREITFSVREGEVLALLGANGAGKSTLMRMLSGEQVPDTGVIYLNGQPLCSYAPEVLARKKATLSQHNTVNMPYMAEEIVMMGRYPHFRNQASVKDRQVVAEAMAVCGVDHLAERNFLTLSGGEQQRVQLARVLAQLWDVQGGLFLLDEPIAAMDILYQQQSLATVKAMARRGCMVIAALHEINLAAQYADRLLMMKNGRRWCDGTPSETLTPLNIYTVFSIDAEVLINPQTLNPYVVPREIRLNAAEFNTLLPGEHAVNEQEPLALNIAG